MSPGREFSITEAYYAVEQEVDKLCTELTSKASDGVIGDYYDIMPGSLGEITPSPRPGCAQMEGEAPRGPWPPAQAPAHIRPCFIVIALADHPDCMRSHVAERKGPPLHLSSAVEVMGVLAALSAGAGAYAVVRQARNIKTGELVRQRCTSRRAPTKPVTLPRFRRLAACPVARRSGLAGVMRAAWSEASCAPRSTI